MDLFYSILEWFGVVLGFFYLYYQYKASPKLWIYGLIMSVVYIIIFTHASVYFWAATNMYNVVIMTYGLYKWRKSPITSEQPESGLKRLPFSKYGYLIAITALLSLVLSYILKNYLDSPIPIPEGISTALSIVAMWLLAKKYMEHWLIWIAVDVFYTIYNVVLDLKPTALLYFVYTIVAVLGYIKWRKIYKEQI